MCLSVYDHVQVAVRLAEDKKEGGRRSDEGDRVGQYGATYGGGLGGVPTAVPRSVEPEPEDTQEDLYQCTLGNALDTVARQKSKMNLSIERGNFYGILQYIQFTAHFAVMKVLSSALTFRDLGDVAFVQEHTQRAIDDMKAAREDIANLYYRSVPFLRSFCEHKFVPEHVKHTITDVLQRVVDKELLKTLYLKTLDDTVKLFEAGIEIGNKVRLSEIVRATT